MMTTLFNIFTLVLVIDAMILCVYLIKEFSGSEEEGPKPMTPIRNIFYSIWIGSAVIASFGSLMYFAYILIEKIFF